MRYFELRSQSIGDASSGAVVVDRFHPRWKEGVQKMMENGRVVPLMEGYASMMTTLSRIPLNLEFDGEVGLKRIRLPDRADLQLIEDGSKTRYLSHNINGFDYIAFASLVINQYLNHLNYFLDQLE